MNENDLSDLVFKNKKEWGFQNVQKVHKSNPRSKKILVPKTKKKSRVDRLVFNFLWVFCRPKMSLIRAWEKNYQHQRIIAAFNKHINTHKTRCSNPSVPRRKALHLHRRRLRCRQRRGRNRIGSAPGRFLGKCFGGFICVRNFSFASGFSAQSDGGAEKIVPGEKFWRV